MNPVDNAALLEAQVFARRRVLGAFLLGAPGGREAAPPRAVRRVVAGATLAGLVLVGALIASLVAPRATIDWSGSGLVLDTDTGALYVIDDDVPDADGPVLRTVANATSARLLGAAGEAAPQQVPGDVVAASPHGPPAGIPTAPPTVPAPDALLPDGWTACTGDRTGMRVAVTDEPAVAPVVPDTGIVVAVGDRRWLLATTPSYDGGAVARRHPVPDDSLPAGTEALVVDPAWLALLPRGDPATGDRMRLPAPDAGTQVCAVLERGADDHPVVRLAVSPREVATAASVPAGTRSVHVSAGHGAVVRSGDGTAYLLAEGGRRHPVDDTALDRLGLGGRAPAAVPEEWLALVPEGVALSVSAARAGPAPGLPDAPAIG